ncbi:MAG TPA: prephenate dehydratase domain-containing protein [Acidobacteriaceae bacterium]|jgi:prephenate dehydratase|nr:prephenate dehydratase domain-containing protein [Acidobacteriaceae bacterium]
MKIGIQGEPGSFSHQAALRTIPNAVVLPCALSADVFEQLRKGSVDAIMIPIENTLAGSVVEHYDLLLEHSVFIERETVIRIEHLVIGIAGSTIEELKRIYSHPVALAQCRSFFQQHPAIEPAAFYDTAGAVKQIIQLQDRHTAAIAGIQAVDIYGGMVLAKGVEDDVANFTRFLLVREGMAASYPQGLHKLSLCCQVLHRPGALAGVLTEIGSAGGNLTQIQSRPVHGQPWHYHVFVDALIPDATAAERLLDRLAAMRVSYKVLGRFAPAPEFV